jgi:RNA recognition motif-containing protein
MGKKLYVGNLPYSTTEESLSDVFSQVGTAESVRIITDRATGRSKGFGFVEMSSDNEAMDAIEKLDGSDFEGRNIKVSEAKEKQGGGRGPGGGGGGNRFGSRDRY